MLYTEYKNLLCFTNKTSSNLLGQNFNKFCSCFRIWRKYFCTVNQQRKDCSREENWIQLLKTRRENAVDYRKFKNRFIIKQIRVLQLSLKMQNLKCTIERSEFLPSKMVLIAITAPTRIR